MPQQDAAPAWGAAGPPPVLILAGGRGSRLRPLLADRPKVLAPLGGRPFLAHLLDRLAGSGLERVVLCTGHLGDQVARAVGPRWGPLEVHCAREERPLGTAGALPPAARHAPGADLLVLNGDSWVEADLARFVAWCRERSGPAAMVLARVEDPSRYGSVEIDSAGRVQGFAEKRENPAGPAWINAGIYFFRRRLLESLPPRRPLSLEREVLPDLVGRELWGWAGGREFIDIGTPASYRRAAALFRGEVTV